MVTSGYPQPAYESLKFYQEISMIRREVFACLEPHRRRYPKLIGQVTDALRSAKQNVIEGYGRDSLGSFLQHLKISRASLAEARGDLDDFSDDIPVIHEQCRAFVDRIDRTMFLLDRYVDSLYRLDQQGGWKTRWGDKRRKVTASNRVVTVSNRPASAGRSNPVVTVSNIRRRGSLQGGFTLLEVLIAASIFASIMLIAVSSFTKMNQLNDRAREVRAVAEAGRFVLDDLERAVSSANGADAKAATTTPPAAAVPAQQSLALCTGPTLLGQATSVLPATKLVTATSTATGATTIRSYYLDPVTKNRLIESIRDPLTGGTTANPITGTDVTIGVADFALTGTSAVAGAASQPYVTIDLTITAVPLRPGLGPVSQHFRTSIVSRDYNVNNHGTGTLCAN
mgnify:CR=1 FL=1